jgi:hypothetical protein
MSRSEESGEYSKHFMPESRRLGKDKDGNVCIEEWNREVKLAVNGAFGDLGEVLETSDELPWTDQFARYEHMVPEKVRDSVTGIVTTRLVKKPFPDKDQDPEEWFYANEKREIFVDKQRRFYKRAPEMITFLLNGTLSKESRSRLLALIDSNKSQVLAQIKAGKDVRRLKAEMERIHDFKGLKSDDKDIEKCEEEMRKFSRRTPIAHGVNVTEHKRNFDELHRKLVSLGALGHTDARDDSFTQKFLFDAFTEPLSAHYHYLVRGRIEAYKQKTVDPHKELPGSIYNEYLVFEDFEKEKNKGEVDGSNRRSGASGNSVHVTNIVPARRDDISKSRRPGSDGKVNSAQASVQRAVNKKFEKKK